MVGYDVIDSDDHKIAEVVDESERYVIVEHGTLKKTRHPIPRAFVNVDEAAGVLHLTVSKEIVHSSPKCGAADGVDDQAVAEHYGLASAYENPPTQGDGEMLPDDPARTAEDDSLSAGILPGAAESQRIRDRMRPGQSNETGSSPGMLGSRKGRN